VWPEVKDLVPVNKTIHIDVFGITCLRFMPDPDMVVSAANP
jgi:hypothetical protein